MFTHTHTHTYIYIYIFNIELNTGAVGHGLRRRLSAGGSHGSLPPDEPLLGRRTKQAYTPNLNPTP